MILYVWSKNFPTAQVSLYGLLPVQAFYLPFVYLGLSLVLGGNPMHCVLGILSGHMWDPTPHDSESCTLVLMQSADTVQDF